MCIRDSNNTMENEQVQIEEKIDYSSADQERDIETASRSLKAMSHPLRLMILCKLGAVSYTHLTLPTTGVV